MKDLIHVLQNLPNKPGIYQYYDTSHRLLYVGKAKNLKKRVKSYFALSQTLESHTPIPNPKTSQRIQLMVRQIGRLEIIIVDSEQDALILENSLIKQLKPKYNVLLRDDKTYPYIALDCSDDFPTPQIVRQITKGKNILYFGPYPSGCRDILESVYELFKLVQKKSCLKGKKACLFHQINRCYAPCEGKISKQEYAQIIQSVIATLKSPQKLLALLHQKMLELSESMRFEEALIYRERIKKLSNLQSFSLIDLAKDTNLDVYGLYYEQRKAILLVLFVREGRIVSCLSDTLFFDYDFIPSEIYTQVILNRYAQKLPLLPKEIVLPSLEGLEIEALSEFLTQRQGSKISIIAPQKGEKLKLIQLAQKNAKEILHQTSQSAHSEESILANLKELLALQSTPFRIEVFDTSHHGGEHCVGGMIVYENGDFDKNSYRRYKLQGSDEYAQMKEMLVRRVQDFGDYPAPNLWLIDGGVAQVRLAREILDSAGVYVDVVGIAKQKIDSKAYRAKGNARDSIYTAHDVFALEPSDKRLQFLQKLRDEAHRYVITYHRQKKKSALTAYNELTQKGLSEAKIKKLLALMGSYGAIKDLDKEALEELLKSKKAATKQTMIKATE